MACRATDRGFAQASRPTVMENWKLEIGNRKLEKKMRGLKLEIRNWNRTRLGEAYLWRSLGQVYSSQFLRPWWIRIRRKVSNFSVL